MGKWSMGSRLDKVQDWGALARGANYNSRKLADVCHISLRQLERFCKDVRRQTPKDWLSDMRMCEARKLLLQGLIIKEVAAALGYKQVSHFCREFKRKIGCTPGRFGSHAPWEAGMSPLDNKCRR
jgi:AraC-like DNA-binding protein